MGTKNDYLPTKYWLEDNTIHRAFFEYEEYLDESPRDWYNLGTMVCGHRRYNLGDIQVRDMEEWEANKPLKKDTLVILPLGLYDHSGITMYVGGRTDPWDSSEVGYIYVRKDNEEVVEYKKTHTWKETEEWAESILRGEVETYDQYLRGDVYCLCEEVYDEETEEWVSVDSLGYIYLDTHKEQESAVNEIKYNMSGTYEFIDEDKILNAIEHHEIDILAGQKVLSFME